MKTISGKVVSSKPTSLSKAAKVLTTFVLAETGASQAVKAYLRRSSDAFTELTQLHRELRTSRSERKSKHHHRSDTINSGVLYETEYHDSRDPRPASDRNLNLDSDRGQSFGESKKRNKRGENLSEVQDGEREVDDSVEMKVEKRKKRKSGLMIQRNDIGRRRKRGDKVKETDDD